MALRVQANNAQRRSEIAHATSTFLKSFKFMALVSATAPEPAHIGKYTERYQYVTRFFSGCHGARLAPLGGLSTNDHRNRIRSDGKAAFASWRANRTTRFPNARPSRPNGGFRRIRLCYCSSQPERNPKLIAFKPSISASPLYFSSPMFSVAHYFHVVASERGGTMKRANSVGSWRACGS